MLGKVLSRVFGKAPRAAAPGDATGSDLPVTEAAAVESPEAQFVQAIQRSMATIEFLPDGTIVDVNDLFLGVVGYQREEVVGKHHRMFVESDYSSSREYAEFWQILRSGQAHSGAFSRVAKGGAIVWIRATYSPVIDDDGQVVRVVKIASDITSAKNRELINDALLAGIDKSQAVIEFTGDGTILKANENFLKTVGYSLEQVVGRHHRMFMPPGTADGQDYRDFWGALAAGKAQQGEFRRVSSKGADIWLHATYMPIQDARGKVTGVVKLALDTTKNKARENIDQAANAIANSLNELASAAKEISERVANSASLTSGVAASAKQADERVSTLGDTSSKISNVIDVIRDLADQTNLLALNATIEAARAGDAGRGFAVVAKEVKELAEQTNRAITQIKEQIDAIQANVGAVAESVEGMAGSSEKVGKNGLEMAAAVEEQSTIIAGLRDQALGLLSSSK